MFDFLKALFKPAPSSGETAKERLRLVLLSDHLSLAPEVIELLKRDLLEVISRYLEIDSEHADVTFEQREREVAMLASIPITAVRDRPRPSPELPFSPEPLAPQPPPADSQLALEPQPVVDEPQVVARKQMAFEAQPAVESKALSDSGAVAESPVVAEKPVSSEAAPRAPESAMELAAPGPAIDAAAAELAASAAELGAPELEFARAAAAKPKPARSGNAAGTRRRRRKKYAAAAAAKANHAPPQSLGGQASAQG